MISQDTLDFLAELEANNNKEWFDVNKNRYDAARKNFLRTADEFIQGASQFDSTVSGLEAKHCIFRIYRDVRFSKDKTPYKTHFGAYIARGGRKSEYPGFYLQVKPGEVFAGGGVYMPPSPKLKKIRHHIDLRGEVLREIIESESFKSNFNQVHGESLKTAPKGYPKDHPEIDLLRRKSFFASKNYDSELALKDDFIDIVLADMETLLPMLEFLRTAMDDEEIA